MLADLLRDQAADLLARWRGAVREQPGCEGLDEALPQILARLEHELRTGEPGTQVALAQGPGALAQVYDAMCTVVFEAVERAGLVLRVDEVRCVMRCFIAASGPLAAAAPVTAEAAALVEARDRVAAMAVLARTSQAQLRLVIDALPFLVSFVTHDERYGLVNRAYEDWFKVSNAAILGRRVVEVVGEAAYARLRPFVLRGLAGERFTFEQRGVPYGSGVRDIRATFVPQRGEGGEVTGYVALLEDISWRLQLEADREGLARDRSEVLALQAAFERQLIGIVSHDLRNPLNVIGLGTQVLLEGGELSGAATKNVQRIAGAADRATRLVDDLLDFTQARHRGGLQLARTACELRSVVQSVVDEVAAGYPRHRLECQLAGRGAGTWDSDRIGQVVQNLVTNACKYSPADSAVTVSLRETDAEVALEVHNIGAPIPADKLPVLFEPYERAAAQTSATNRSVGLGLYIVKLIVEAHGGEVGVTSSADAGTTFRVRLPRSA